MYNLSPKDGPESILILPGVNGNTGEGGTVLQEYPLYLNALNRIFPHWDTYSWPFHSQTFETKAVSAGHIESSIKSSISFVPVVILV